MEALQLDETDADDLLPPVLERSAPLEETTVLDAEIPPPILERSVPLQEIAMGGRV